MNTISRILGPSITLLCPLVGSSLASDWVRFFEIEPALRQCITKNRGGIQPLSFLDIGILLMYMYNKGQ